MSSAERRTRLGDASFLVRLGLRRKSFLPHRRFVTILEEHLSGGYVLPRTLPLCQRLSPHSSPVPVPFVHKCILCPPHLGFLPLHLVTVSKACLTRPSVTFFAYWGLKFSPTQSPHVPEDACFTVPT